MVADITTAVSGLISAIGTILNPLANLGGTGNATEAVAWVTLLALPVLGGSVAMARRIIKKAR